jgi:hypothetical protein
LLGGSRLQPSHGVAVKICYASSILFGRNEGILDPQILARPSKLHGWRRLYGPEQPEMVFVSRLLRAVVSLPIGCQGHLATRSSGITAERGGVSRMQYAKIIALIKEAELAGEARTEFVNERLADAFDIWLAEQDLSEITEEEEQDLRRAFEKGFGICLHHAQ